MYYDGGFGFICKKIILERWTDFEVAWRKLAMQRWEIDASKGDSENFRYGWGLDFIKIKEHIGVKDLPRLRTATPNMLDDDSPSNWLPSRMNVFYFVDDEVVDSVLEGPSKAEIPFIYAVAGT
jgi:hypothetical protein